MNKKEWKIGQTMKVKIKDLKREYNPRQDFSHVPALAASIKERGQDEAILVNIRDGSVIDGESRIQAMESLKLPEIDTKFKDMEPKEAESFQLRVFRTREQLTPLEEADAFRHYLDTHKANPEQLAKEIGTRKDYIERRLALSGLTKEARTALNKKEIKLGHAVILARLDPKTQKQTLQEAKEENVDVFADVIYVNYDEIVVSLEDAKFNMEECKNCKHNGGSQTLLLDITSEYNAADNLHTKCLNPTCFRKKQRAWTKARTEALKKKGATVLTKEEIEKLPIHREIKDWDTQNLNQAKKELTSNPDTYALSIDKEGNETYFQIKEQKKTKDTGNTPTNAAKSENNIKQKISIFKHEFLIRKCRNLTKPNTTQASALILLALADDITIKDKGLFGMTQEKLNIAILNAASDHLQTMSNLELMSFGKEVGLDLKKDFTITEEYLDLHTKDQIIDLAKELTLPLEIRDNLKGSKKEIIGLFLTAKLEGLIPKSIEE